MNLAEKVVAIHSALNDVPHAFGGALALAYYAEPRATIDIDLNVFVGPAAIAEVITPLSAIGITFDAGAPAAAERDGQLRTWWEHTPLDLFFSYDRFHEAARKAARDVPFATTTIPILSPEHLVVCKAVFDRPKDWVDIAAILADDTHPEIAECLRWLGRIVGDTDRRYDRLASMLG
jgi:hypothetical protein